MPLMLVLKLVPCGSYCIDEPLRLLLMGERRTEPDGRVPELLKILELIGDDTIVPRYPGAFATST